MRFLISMLLVFILGCATGLSGQLRFQDRELIIHPDKSGLGYPMKVVKCKGKFIFKKCKTTYPVEFYDLNDKAVRDKLRNAGFRCKSKMRFKY